FGCDLSATVGGIPNFGRKSSSRKVASKRCKEGAGQALSTDCRPRLWADGWPVISSGMSGIDQSNRQLRPYPWPRSPLAAAADRAFARPRNPARLYSRSSGEAVFARGRSNLNFECVACVALWQQPGGWGTTERTIATSLATSRN